MRRLLVAILFSAAVPASAGQWSAFDKGPNYEIYINLQSIRPLGDAKVRFQTVTNYESVMRYERLWYRSMTLTRVIDCKRQQFRIESASIYSKFFAEGQYLLNPQFPYDPKIIPVNSAVERLAGLLCSQYSPSEKKKTQT
ncbi:MAG: hypothetical protein EBR85_01730 [Betaproteobacteria bacterium]|jgi:hypothetical protein|nr:hypothetical protein [Betaproteobacteria bacterium]